MKSTDSKALVTGWKSESDRVYFSRFAFNNTYLSELYNWDRYMPFEVPGYPVKLAYLIGRALHIFGLQHTLFHKWVKQLPEGRADSKKVKDALSDLEEQRKSNPDMIILNYSDYEDVIEMGEKLNAHSEAQELLAGCITEQSGYRGFKFSTGQTVFFKCKIDARRPNLINEIKTTRATNKWEIQKAVDTYNYDMQAFNYRFQANSIEEFNQSRLRYEKFWWIFIAKGAKGDKPKVICYELSDADALIGQRKWEAAFSILRNYYEKGIKNSTLECPVWKEKRYGYLLG